MSRKKITIEEQDNGLYKIEIDNSLGIGMETKFRNVEILEEEKGLLDKIIQRHIDKIRND